MATSNTFTSLNGMFKECYGDKLENLIPDGVKLLNRISFVSKEKQLGNSFHQPVILGLEHGVTFAGPDDDAFTLNDAIRGVTKDASVKGNQLVMRSLLGYAAASRAAQGGQKAFMDATKFLVANMMRSMARKLEIEMLYGQMGYGVVASVSGLVITISTAEWAPGIWAGSEGMQIQIRDVTGATLRTGTATITAVDMDARTITVDALPTGTVATDVIWHYGAYGNEFAGIHKIITNTGTIFGINAASYNLFKGNTYSAASAALSFSKIQSATSKAVEKGLDGKLLCLVNPRTWANLLSDQAALRMYDDSYKSEKVENGSRGIKFHSQNGEIEVEPSIFVKEGYAFLIALDTYSRIGSTDVTFKRPSQGDEFFRDVENSAAYELRAYTDQALFCFAPGHSVLINNIVNT
jgi:hypothetical protein